MRNFFIVGALVVACADGSHPEDVSRFVGVWQTTGGSASYQCSDGSSGPKSVGMDQYTIGAGASSDLTTMTSGGCTILFNVSGTRATSQSLVCPGKEFTATITLVLSNNVITWNETDSGPDSSGTTCTDTVTILLAHAARN